MKEEYIAYLVAKAILEVLICFFMNKWLKIVIKILIIICFEHNLIYTILIYLFVYVYIVINYHDESGFKSRLIHTSFLFKKGKVKGLSY